MFKFASLLQSNGFELCTIYTHTWCTLIPTPWMCVLDSSVYYCCFMGRPWLIKAWKHVSVLCNVYLSFTFKDRSNVGVYGIHWCRHPQMTSLQLDPLSSGKYYSHILLSFSSKEAFTPCIISCFLIWQLILRLRGMGQS